MIALEDGRMAFRVRFMARAGELRKVTAATCRELKIGSTLFYRWRRRFQD